MQKSDLKRGNGFYYILFGLLLLSIAIFFFKNKFYTPIKAPEEVSFFHFYKEKISTSKSLGVRPGNEEKLIHYGKSTNRAILYIHGFGASRAEGEFVTDSLSKKWQANTYYLRLPGHGIDKLAHEEATYVQYLQEVEEALYRVQELGDTVIIIGTSMGGLLATYLAAEYPDMVQALILLSPFYDYGHPLGVFVKIPGLIDLFALLNNNERKFTPSEESQKRRHAAYPNFWIDEQKLTAVKSLENLRVFAAKPSNYSRIEMPCLLLYYYKDEENQDGAASVAAMLSAWEAFPVKHKMKFAIEDASHVLASAYLKTDKDAVFKAVSTWNEAWVK